MITSVNTYLAFEWRESEQLKLTYDAYYVTRTIHRRRMYILMFVLTVDHCGGGCDEL